MQSHCRTRYHRNTTYVQLASSTKQGPGVAWIEPSSARFPVSGSSGINVKFWNSSSSYHSAYIDWVMVLSFRSNPAMFSDRQVKFRYGKKMMSTPSLLVTCKKKKPNGSLNAQKRLCFSSLQNQEKCQYLLPQRYTMYAVHILTRETFLRSQQRLKHVK